MKANAVIRARINEDIRDQAAIVLADMGLTVSDAVRILLTKIAKERTFPIDLSPNALTVETLEKSNRGVDLHQAESADDLFAQMGL